MSGKWIFETHTIYKDKNNVTRDRRDVITADSDREAKEILKNKVKHSGGELVHSPYLNRRTKK